MDGLARVLLITRSFPDFSAAKDSVRVNGGAEIEAVIGATVELDDIIKTKIASSDMAAYVVPSGTTFRKEAMTDEFGQGGEEVVVAGMMEIGLFQRSGSAGKVLRKPKVSSSRIWSNPKLKSKAKSSEGPVARPVSCQNDLQSPLRRFPACQSQSADRIGKKCERGRLHSCLLSTDFE